MEIRIKLPVMGFDREDLVGSFASAAASCGARLVKNEKQAGELVLGFSPDSPELQKAVSHMARSMGIGSRNDDTPPPKTPAQVPAATALAIPAVGLYARILTALSERFIRCEEIARILALAIESGKNVLLWGPGGHGKSEMVQAALDTVAEELDVFVQSFGEGMDEATLWGGLDFAALDRDKVLLYHPENSFLAKPFAVFEEMFDAPASVLLALKDSLTARKLRKGNQVYGMKTKVIIAITNKDPQEIEDLGPAAKALVERFPLQLNVKWVSYTAQDYLALFNKVTPFLSGADLNGSMGVLAEIMAKAGEGDQPISPRSAVYALSVVKSAAALRGGQKVEKEDLIDLKFIDGLEGLAENIRQELEAAYERAAAEKRLAEAEAEMRGLMQEWDEISSSPIKLLQMAKKLTGLQDKVAGLKITDGLSERRKQLRESVAQKITEAQTAALNVTRI